MARNRRTPRTTDTRSVRAAERAAHFASGGTPQTWRGRPATFADAKTKAARNRGAGRRRAIREAW